MHTHSYYFNLPANKQSLAHMKHNASAQKHSPQDPWRCLKELWYWGLLSGSQEFLFLAWFSSFSRAVVFNTTQHNYKVTKLPLGNKLYFNTWNIHNTTSNQRKHKHMKIYLQYFHHNLLIVCNVYGFKHFTVLSSSQLSHKLVVILISEAQKHQTGKYY